MGNNNFIKQKQDIIVINLLDPFFTEKYRCQLDARPEWFLINHFPNTQHPTEIFPMEHVTLWKTIGRTVVVFDKDDILGRWY